MNAPDLTPSTERPTRSWIRVLVPVAAIGVALGTFAVAQAATTSGTDSTRDVAEQGVPTEAPTTVSPRSEVAGSSDDTSDDSSDDSVGEVADHDDNDETESFLPSTLADGATQTFPAGNAGSVTISRAGDTLTVVAVSANPGWVTVIEEGSGHEVEVSFRNGDAQTDLEAELEDGTVQVHVSERSASDDSEDSDESDDSGRESGSGSDHSGNSGSRHSGSDDD